MSDSSDVALLGSGFADLEPPLMTDIPDQPSPLSSKSNTDDRVGFGRPPKHSRFTKGTSGNPAGRPKRLEGISIKEVLDGDQVGKNGKIISKREAFVIALVNDALGCNQKAFLKFMKLMDRSGLLRREQTNNPTVIRVPSRIGTMEEFDRNFGRPADETDMR